ncbi:TPA: tRNA (N6-isopentenyl adenosine(37)-C2)-methylthiotransferase MiaB [Candidatus Falkowbacteria bacterium]|nr:MAG: (Dimethylallyl)adenosine tRNA methylthiotransferase MiaB [Candidatus Falkowbacteria bacterium GW2011_GWF2_43_32]HBA36347.1 tRNA (N6-isopentenyl adenosine(37)-C2)-methylthiotransferase MiaB [Candidatus Falkowbacteria bacterium]
MKTYHIITIGCQMNYADSERLAAYLDSRGFKLGNDVYKTDVVILNTCGVRQAAEDRVYGLVNQIRKYNEAAQIVITGCLSRREDVKKRLSDRADIFLPINEVLALPKLLDGKKFQPRFSLEEIRLEQGEKYLDILPKRSTSFTAYVPIGNGCNNFCSYCVVPYARGREVYRSAAEIIKEVRGLIAAGYKEIVLIAQNVNSYRSGSYDFPKLLAKLAAMPGKFWLRFFSSHPKDMSVDLIKVIATSAKVCGHLHLAVQSGDDRILKAMNRRYTAAQYKKLIKQVRAARPGMAVTTDVIVGFPGETKKQFANTVKLFREVGFDMAYIAQYSPRPGTAAYRLNDDVPAVEKKRRARILNDLLTKTALANNRRYLHQTVEVLIDGRNRRGKYSGKAAAYQTVSVELAKSKKTKNQIGRGAGADLIGEFVAVKITKARPFGLEGILAE